MKTFFKAIVLTIPLMLCLHSAQAQEPAKAYDPKDYRKKPVWIDMMDDPNANYFETIKAFRVYWKDYALPGEPAELEGRDRFEKEIGLEADEKDSKREKEHRKQRKDEGYDLVFQVKRFKGWYQEAQPWVQANGHILTQEERQKIVDQQQEELKRLEKSQKN